MSNSNKYGLWNLTKRNFVFYWRSNILFAAGCAVSAMILVGALLIGTSLRESLRGLHKPRLGEIRWVINSSSGFFRESLADSISTYLSIKTAPILPMTGSVQAVGGVSGGLRVNIVGVDDRFWKLAANGKYVQQHDGGAIINSAAAEKLGVNLGDQIILRFQTAGSLAMDAPFGMDENLSALNLSIASIANKNEFGDFSLKAEHFTVYNVFVPLELLQITNKIAKMAPVILIGEPSDKSIQITDELIIGTIQNCLDIKDAGLNIRNVGDNFEIYSDRIFITDRLKNMIVNTIPKAIPVSAWFVNSIDNLEKSIPYSFVSTLPVNYELDDNQIILANWAADDLGAKIGDTITLTYFVPRPTSGLRTDTSIFIVRDVHNQGTSSWLNHSLMPPYPGLADASSCTDWGPSIPVDLDKIRTKDEEYWEKYAGTPKAIINYNMAEQIWNNRFGTCTAIRIQDSITTPILSSLTPQLCGMQLTDIRANIDLAINKGIDFAPLFIGLSFFALAAALLLIWLLSTLQIKSRAAEHGVLKSIGYSQKHILQIYLSEGLIIFFIGTVLGIILAPFYTHAVIFALKTVWSATAKVPELNLHIDLKSICTGGITAFICALIAMLIPVFSSTAIKKDAKLRTATSRISTTHFSKRKLVGLNIRHEWKRAIGQASILACALFILGTTQLFQNHNKISYDRSSGTGGFTLYGELNSGISLEEAGADFLRERKINVYEYDSIFTSFAMRMKDGDDASCLNLNQAQSPVLLGANQTFLDSVGAFSFASMIDNANKKHPWRILGTSTGCKNTVYGIADVNTITWGLGKAIGDTLMFINEQGDTLNIILVAGLKKTVLQGKVIIAETDFIHHYPSISGYRLLLISASPYNEKEIANEFQNYHGKNGLWIDAADQRLNHFNAVENTYLSIFAFLGIIGLIIGCAGLGIVVLHDVMGRRYEFAALMAQGFSIGAIRLMLFAEHAIIAASGMVAGLLPAAIAVIIWETNVEHCWKSLLSAKIISMPIIVLLCGIGSIAAGLYKLKSMDLSMMLKEDAG